MYGVMRIIRNSKELLPTIYDNKKYAEEFASMFSELYGRVGLTGIVVELKIAGLGEQEGLHRSGPKGGDGAYVTTEDLTAEIS